MILCQIFCSVHVDNKNEIKVSKGNFCLLNLLPGMSLDSKIAKSIHMLELTNTRYSFIKWCR